MIKLDSSGTVFYRGERTGQFDKQFRIYKFRTMIQNADKTGCFSTANDDKRLTKLSSFLKKYQIDELPQLINVFKGEMSFVGWRPDIKRFTDMLEGEEKAILLEKPGITDWASLWNFHEGELLNGSLDPDQTYKDIIRPEKIKLQLKYINEKSFSTDMKIIFLTIKKVFCQ